MNNFKTFLVLSLAFFTGCAGKGAPQSSADSLADAGPQTEQEINNDTVSEQLKPAQYRALLGAYPDLIKEINDNQVILFDGQKITYDDGLTKDHSGRLDNSDVEDMFYDVYALPDPEPSFQYDPGRSRSEALFKAMYGKSSAEVQKKLVPVEWFGQKVQFMSLNGAADSLRAVAKEIALYPELRPYLKSSGTFYWRQVRGAKRMSAHSYGIAFDIGVDKSDYWLWKSGSNDENKKVKYSNRIPRKLVEIFQKHGFIWGGSWYHFDTMHFEFRPELLLYAELKAQEP